jgi:glycolate oxidase FAD binding subunit
MSDTYLPESETDLADMIRTHVGTGKPLAITGGNTRSGFGHAVSGKSLSLAGLSGITAYNPAELTMTAKAGTPVADIEAALAQNGQCMVFEPMDHRALMGTTGTPTIGGIFASNASGPRRFVAGAARDSLLGVRFVNGVGEVVKSGGRVMKNVTGLDLVKLLAGSYGTLGVLSEVTFKVQPRAQDSATIVIHGLMEDQATLAMAAAMRMSVEVSGAAHLPASISSAFIEGTSGVTVLRLEGLAASVAVRKLKLTEAMQAFGAVETLDHAATGALWAQIRDVTPLGKSLQKPLWRVSVAPSKGHSLLNALRMEAGVDGFLDWQGGLLWLQMEAEPEAVILRRLIRASGGGHATLIRADALQRLAIPAFEPQPLPVRELAKRLKLKFDPHGVLNPDRMEGSV